MPDESALEQARQERELYGGVEQKGQPDPLYRLEVSTTGVMTDGRNLHIRGRLRNPMPEPVDGVRLLFAVYDSGVGTTSPPKEVVQEEKDVQLPPGGTTALRMDVATMYAKGHGSFRVDAYARRVGGRDIPPPPGWKEEE
jgi:hypothetical protein